MIHKVTIILQTSHENEQTSLYKTWVQSRSIFNSQMPDKTVGLQAPAALSQQSGEAEGAPHYRDLAKTTPPTLVIFLGFLHLHVLSLEECDTVIGSLRVDYPSDFVR